MRESTSRTQRPVVVIDSQPVANQDEKMNVQERTRGFRIGVGVLAALCAVLLGLTALSGCRIYVVGSTPRNPFLGEWHAEFPSAGGRLSYEYVFESDGSYTYISALASGTGGVLTRILGTYDYDDETLILEPNSSIVPSSLLRYKFQNDDELQLESQIDTGLTVTLTFHRHP